MKKNEIKKFGNIKNRFPETTKLEPKQHCFVLVVAGYFDGWLSYIHVSHTISPYNVSSHNPHCREFQLIVGPLKTTLKQ